MPAPGPPERLQADSGGGWTLHLAIPYRLFFRLIPRPFFQASCAALRPRLLPTGFNLAHVEAAAHELGGIHGTGRGDVTALIVEAPISGRHLAILG